MIKHLIAVFIGILSIIPIQLHARKYYCEIKGMQKELSSELKIVFDFGESQVYSIWSGLKSEQKLVDENGEEIEFTSMVDAANYMSEKCLPYELEYLNKFE